MSSIRFTKTSTINRKRKRRVIKKQYCIIRIYGLKEYKIRVCIDWLKENKRRKWRLNDKIIEGNYLLNQGWYHFWIER
jgi:hypothetical protein